MAATARNIVRKKAQVKIARAVEERLPTMIMPKRNTVPVSKREGWQSVHVYIQVGNVAFAPAHAVRWTVRLAKRISQDLLP
jgi:hypothetical protein